MQDACAAGKVDLDRVTGIFADNGRGKSTFAAVLRACQLGEGGRLKARQTIDSDDPPQLHFLLPNGNHLRFDGNAWIGIAPEIVVFDSEFVEQNVYSGSEVRPDQRQALLSFALGDQTVQLTRGVERLTQEISEQTTKRTQAEHTLSGCREPYTLADFIALLPVKDAQSQLDALHKRLEAAKNAEQLSVRQNPLPLQIVGFDRDALFATLAKELANVEDSAEAVVKAHLTGRAQDEFEEWISRGQQYVTGEDCPFCGQGISELDLIRAYRTHFNEQYQALKAEVASLEKDIKSAFATANVDAMAAAVDANHARIQAWADQLQLAIPDLDWDLLRAEYEKIRESLLSLASEKEKQPLVAVGNGEVRAQIEENVAVVNDCLSRYNAEVATVAARIAEFKQNLAADNPSLLKAEIRKLEAAMRRQQAHIMAAVGEYQASEAERKRLESEKKRPGRTLTG